MVDLDRTRLHPLLTQPIGVNSGVAGVERPIRLVDAIRDEPDALLSLANHHVVSARQFTRSLVNQLSRMAAQIEGTPYVMHKPLAGKILISAFYEPSTRTRSSFESAWHRLGGDIISITDMNTTGIAKGESLADIAEMFSNYGDVIVLRDSDENSVYEMLACLRIPIINAGNGIDEHPTQSLADLYTILKWRPDIAHQETLQSKIRVGIIGTPNKMRTVRSLLLMLSLYDHAIDEVIIINPESEVFDAEQRHELESAGLKLRVENRLKSVLPELDVVYINSIAWIGDSYETLTGDIKLSSESTLKEDAIVLHPLARGDELDTSLDNSEHNWYFAQARGAVFIRMALLTCLTQRASSMLDVAEPRKEGV